MQVQMGGNETLGGGQVVLGGGTRSQEGKGVKSRS